MVCGDSVRGEFVVFLDLGVKRETVRFEIDVGVIGRSVLDCIRTDVVWNGKNYLCLWWCISSSELKGGCSLHLQRLVCAFVFVKILFSSRLVRLNVC